MLIMSMKLISILTIAILALVLSVNIVSATHTPQVLLNPSEWKAQTTQTVYLSVKNNGPDNIVKVELDMPLNSDGASIYKIGDIAKPSGWNFEQWPTKIIWKATGTGMAVNDAADFGFEAQSPASGQYQWSWITTDSTGAKFSGTSTTRISMASLSYFKIDGVPAKLTAGNSFKVTVRAYSTDNTVKTDYTGAISFTASDSKALIPKDYTFTSSDRGAKDFYVTYKTAGDQTVTITDWSAKIAQKSAVTSVEAGSLISMAISPDSAQVSPKGAVKFTAMAKDKFDNEVVITNMTKWSIDKEAGGSWNSNVYTAENEGTWTVMGTYNALVDGESLVVKSGAVVTPVQPTTPEVTETIPTVTNQTPETPVVVTPTPSQGMSIETDDSLNIAPGSNETFIVTVKNDGTGVLSDVTLATMNIPSEWVSIYPSKITIDAGTSRDFLVVVSVPENTTEAVSMDVIANSNEGVKATKTVEVSVATAPTGLMGLSKNLLNLGIVIVAVAALVLIAWELWFRKSK
jgi:hypothetical protein